MQKKLKSQSFSGHQFLGRTPVICVARPSRSGKSLAIAGREHDFIVALVCLTCAIDHAGHPALMFPSRHEAYPPAPHAGR